MDYIDTKAVEDSQATLDSVKAAAAASFKDQASVKAEAGHKSENKVTKGYSSSVRNSETRTKGGPDVTKLLRSFSRESAKVQDPKGPGSAYFALDDLVALDHFGQFIYDTITTNYKSGVNFSTAHMANIVDHIGNATDKYYEVNGMSGCLDPKAKNYEPSSNVNGSSTCNYGTRKFILGGFVGGCNLLNGITGSQECPISHPKGELLLTGMVYTKEPAECISLSWCKGDDVRANSGYMFGGMYSDQKPNPVTGFPSCPGRFRPVHLGESIVACLSRNYEMDYKDSVEFGGLFSCMTPEENQDCGTEYSNYLVGRFYSMLLFPPNYQWKKDKAPRIDYTSAVHGCELYFCGSPKDMKAYKMARVKRPPFMDAPGLKIADDVHNATAKKP